MTKKQKELVLKAIEQERERIERSIIEEAQVARSKNEELGIRRVIDIVRGKA